MSRDITDPEDARLAAAVRAMSEELRHDAGHHPSNDELLAYHERELSSDEAETLRDHLALCPECTERGLELATFSRSYAAEEDPFPEEAVEDWKALRNVLEAESLLARPEKATAGRSVASPLAGFLGSPRLAYAVAALFFVTTLALSAWLATELRTVARLSRPASFQMVDLHPADQVRRDAAVAREPVVAATDGDLGFNLNLFPGGRPLEGPYRAEISDRQRPDLVKWTVEPLEPDSEGFFAVRISGRDLVPGGYEIRLFGAGGDLLATYRFRVKNDP